MLCFDMNDTNHYIEKQFSEYQRTTIDEVLISDLRRELFCFLKHIQFVDRKHIESYLISRHHSHRAIQDLLNSRDLQYEEMKLHIYGLNPKNLLSYCEKKLEEWKETGDTFSSINNVHQTYMESLSNQRQKVLNILHALQRREPEELEVDRSFDKISDETDTLIPSKKGLIAHCAQTTGLLNNGFKKLAKSIEDRYTKMNSEIPYKPLNSRERHLDSPDLSKNEKKLEIQVSPQFSYEVDKCSTSTSIHDKRSMLHQRSRNKNTFTERRPMNTGESEEEKMKRLTEYARERFAKRYTVNNQSNKSFLMPNESEIVVDGQNSDAINYHHRIDQQITSADKHIRKGFHGTRDVSYVKR